MFMIDGLIHVISRNELVSVRRRCFLEKNYTQILMDSRNHISNQD